MTTARQKVLAAFDDSNTELRKELQGALLKGARIGAIAGLGPILFIYVIYLLGTLLPPESKEADDPLPGSFSAYEVTVPSVA